MLKGLRKNTKTIIWTVIACFALWGGYAVSVELGQQDARFAGEVFGKKITYQDFDSFYRSSQIFSFSGKKIEDPQTLRLHAWQTLIYSLEAKNQRIDVSDQEIRDEILRILKEDKVENPTPEIYRRWVQAATRQTPQEFENQIREILRVQKLVKHVNEEPLAAPAPEEIKQKFLDDYNHLSIEILRFDKEDEAKSFGIGAGTAALWKEKTKEKKVEKTSLITHGALIQLWGIPRPLLEELQKLAVGTVLGPRPVGNQFALYFLADKKDADLSKFETEFKAKVMETMTQQKKYERFLNWNLKVMERAALKDFLPQLEETALNENQLPPNSQDSPPTAAPGSSPATSSAAG